VVAVDKGLDAGEAVNALNASSSAGQNASTR